MGLTCVTNFIVTAVTILFFPNLSKNFSNYPLAAPSANVMELNHPAAFNRTSRLLLTEELFVTLLLLPSFCKGVQR